MTDSAWPLVLYAGLAMVVVLVIFFGAAWLVSTAKKRNVRFKWGERAPREQR